MSEYDSSPRGYATQALTVHVSVLFPIYAVFFSALPPFSTLRIFFAECLGENWA